MAIELDGKPLKFTAEFDSTKAEQDLDSFLKKLQNLNSTGSAGNSISSAIGRSSSQFKTIFQDATQSYNAFNDSVNNFYSKIANGELQLQKIRNEQTILNRELKNGTITEQEYINKTARLTQVRQELSAQIKENKNLLSQYNRELERKPAFTKKDTLNELASAHGAMSGAPSPNLSATEAFAKLTQESIDKLNRELTELEAKLKQGIISNQEYAKSSEAINNSLKELNLDQERFNKNVGKGLVPTTEVKEQKTILDSVSAQYREMVENATSAFQMISPEAKKLNNDLVALRQENKNITAAQKELTSSFESGIITEKQYIQASRDLGVQQREVKYRISETQKAIAALDNSERQSLGSIAEKSAKLAQLKQKYEQLTAAQRNNINIGGKIRQEYQVLSNEVSLLNSSLSGTKSSGIASVFSSIRGIAGAVGVAFGTQQLVQFGIELFNIAKQAEGIELRFAKIGDTSGLDKLRVATKGTVSDLELMKQAIKADNFRIPMDVLAKGLQFATQRATETGESVDYLVESFTKGLGRKSKLILDNLGISVVELNKEIEQTGDFATAVGNIIDREMAKSGQAVDTLAEKTNRLGAQWSNLTKNIANAFNRFNNPGLIETKNIEKLTEQYKAGFDAIKSGSKEVKQAFIEDSQAQLKSINNTIKALTLDSPEFKKLYGESKSKKSLFKYETPEDFLSKLQKPLVEQQQALQASLTYARGISEEMAKQERHSKNIYSQAEVEEKLSEANLLYKNSVGDNARATARKEVEKWQKLYDGMNIKSIEKANKKGETEFEKQRQAVERLLSLQLKVDQINEKVKNSNLSRDDQEIESIKDKYKQIREEVRKFEADPKNRGKKVNVSGLAASERFEMSEANIRVQNRANLETLEEQKKLYEQFEDFKLKLGSDRAKELMGNQIDTTKTYLQFIEDELGKVVEIDQTKMTASQKEYYDAVVKMQIEASRDNENAQKDLLASLSTFQDQRLAIIEDYEANRAKLIASGNIKEAQQLKTQTDDTLKQLRIDEVEKHADFIKAMENIDFASNAMLGNAFRAGKQTVEKIIDGLTDATEEQKAHLKKLLGKFFEDGAKDADRGLFNNIANAGEEFGNLVNQAFQFNKELDGGASSLGAMVTSAAKLAATIADTLGKSGESLGKSGGPLAIVGAFMQIVSGLVTGIQQAQRAKIAKVQAEADASHDRQMRATQAMTKALEIQLELIENIYGADRLAKYASSLTEIINEYSKLNDMLSGRYAMTGDAYVDGILKSLNEGKTKKQIYAELADQYSVVSKEYMGADKIFKNLDKYIRLDNLPKDIKQAREELARLQRDIALNGVDEKTQAIIDQLEQQIDLYEKTANKLKEESTGNSFASILSDVTQLFLAEGENAADAWAKGFDKIMENYLLQKFTRDYLQKAMQGWYEEMDAYAKSGGGIDDDEKDRLKESLEAIRKEGDRQLDIIKDALGYDPTKSDSTSSLKADSGIRGITEQTANRLESEFGGMRLAQLELLQLTKTNGANYLEIANSHLTELIAIQHNTYRTANNTDRLANIETAIVSLNNKVSSSDAARRGAGL